jgi:hypothetical protein
VLVGVVVVVLEPGVVEVVVLGTVVVVDVVVVDEVVVVGRTVVVVTGRRTMVTVRATWANH